MEASDCSHVGSVEPDQSVMGIVQAVAAGGSMELMGTVTPRSK
jgi:hypothetical protein